MNVATGAHYLKGQARLKEVLDRLGETHLMWEKLPPYWPAHARVPYGFKAYAMNEAGCFDSLLWCDSCIVPVGSMEALWERIDRDGYWFSKNGWSNYEWTADSAYPDLFPDMQNPLRSGREQNRKIPHVVATSFGISMKHQIGRAFMAEYFRLASETKAFCGPWVNADCENPRTPRNSVDGTRVAPCGPPDVRGHRHDQTAASVIAWRLGMQLTNPPDVFAYRGGETEDTILLADGAY